jgi:hypothetical protein
MPSVKRNVIQIKKRGAAGHKCASPSFSLFHTLLMLWQKPELREDLIDSIYFSLHR